MKRIHFIQFMTPDLRSIILIMNQPAAASALSLLRSSKTHPLPRQRFDEFLQHYIVICRPIPRGKDMNQTPFHETNESKGSH